MWIDGGKRSEGPVFRPKRVAHAQFDRQGRPTRLALERGGDLPEVTQERRSFVRDPGSVRGLFCPAPDPAQETLIRALSGSLVAVAVDVRGGSDTYGDWVSLPLNATNARSFLVPYGFLYGFASRAPDTVVSLKFTAAGAQTDQSAVNFADPELGIDWGAPLHQLTATPQSRAAPMLAQWRTPFEALENVA